MVAEPLEVITYIQPGDRRVKITLKRWESECCRLVNDQLVESWIVLAEEPLFGVFKGWIRFEQKIGSLQI